MKKLFIAAWLVIACHLVDTTYAQNLKPADFAYGIQVDTVGHQPVQAFVLPQAVYEHLTRDDLGDLRVFNSEGAVIPHALHYAPEIPEAAKETYTLPLFPVYGPAQHSLRELGVQVQRTRAGTLIRINEKARAQQTLRAYIVDASQIEDAVHKLKFDWKELPENLMVNISIETSDNLVNWQSWGSRQTLTSMRYNESVLIKNIIDLPAREASYYRISWQKSSAFPLLDHLEATITSGRPELERHQANVALKQEEDGIYVASIPGTIPADRVEIELPEAQTIVRIKVESSQDGEYWTHHFSGLAYNLQAGDDQWRSPPISVYKNSHRFWRLTVDEDASGILLGTPSLRFGWTPARLLFVPQGTPPYTLAFGNANAEAAGFHSTELFRPVANDFDDVFDLPKASLGAINKLGGEERLKETTELPWQQLVLWGSMLIGVGVLGLLALRLMRQPAEK